MKQPITNLIYVNISSSFFHRARCKDCGQGPNFWYASRKPFLWKDVDNYLFASQSSRKFVSRMNDDWYQYSNPRNFHGISTFTFAVEDKHYLPKLHKVRGADVLVVHNVDQFLSCECGHTTWAINQKSVEKQPEITNRKGRYNYPKGFD